MSRRVDLSLLPGSVRRLLRIVGREAQDQGARAFLVGGVVRDLILKRPVTDVDVVVEGSAIALARRLHRREGWPLTVHKTFQTASLRVKKTLTLDVATCRSETYPRPGALPVVRPGTLEEDLFRRDFSINALACAIFPERWGEVWDVCGGWDDLKAGRIRILHDRSFEDDPTRLIRAVRFAHRFGFDWDHRTRRAWRAAVQHHGERTVTRSRLFTEFRRMSREPRPVEAFLTLLNLGGRHLWADPCDRVERERLKEWGRRSEAARVRGLRGFDGRWEDVALLAFMVFARPRAFDRWAREVHLTREERRRVDVCREWPKMARWLAGRRLQPSQVDERLGSWDDRALAFLLLALSDGRARANGLRYGRQRALTRLSLTGRDLQRAGLRPGRAMGQLLKALYRQKLDGRLRTRRQELAAARQWMATVNACP